MDVHNPGAEALQLGSDALFGCAGMDRVEAGTDPFQWTGNFGIVGLQQRNLVAAVLQERFLGLDHNVFPAGELVAIVDEQDPHSHLHEHTRIISRAQAVSLGHNSRTIMGIPP